MVAESANWSSIFSAEKLVKIIRYSHAVYRVYMYILLSFSLIKHVTSVSQVENTGQQ